MTDRDTIFYHEDDDYINSAYEQGYSDAMSNTQRLWNPYIGKGYHAMQAYTDGRRDAKGDHMRDQNK